MSVLDGPGEGTWSVFAAKVMEERDELRHKLAGEAAHIKSLEGLLVDAVRERDLLKNHYSPEAAAKLRAELASARAEVEMLRERLEVERTPNGAGKWNAERVLREKAERERDELKTRLAHAEADAEQAVHNEAFNERMKIAEWLRARIAHLSLDSRTTMQALDSLRTVADEIERGEHER